MAGTKDVVLGLTHHGTDPNPSGLSPCPREAIEVFGRARNASSYRYWQTQKLCSVSPDFGFEQAFGEATSNCRTIHFNLDGFDLSQGWKLGQMRDPYAAGITNWEFVKLLTDPELRRKTAFWQNGRIVPLQRVLARTGITQHDIP